jgi:glycosyltransferase involved in cell wall biosynthesis
MRVAIVSTYQPRPCGIAVFSSDLRAALLEADSSLSVKIVSMLRGNLRSNPPEVIATIRRDVASDYAAAASVLGRSGVDVVLIEHEYGIFGGDSGNFVLRLASQLTVPMVVTPHTVLASPSASQAATLRALCGRAALVLVFTKTARRMVVEQGLADFDRVRVVPHGAPDELTQAAWSDGVDADITGSSLQLGLPSMAGRTVLSTFGLISASKGLELAVRALPAITAVHPEVVYLIAGQTHPEVINKEGESYRLGLQRLIHALDLGDHVWFIDRFLTIDELAMLLARTDIYLTPYRSKDQIVSGALTFALAAGCPVVSTPYFYAADLLNSGAGALVPFGDFPKLAAAVLELLGSPAKLNSARAEARRVGAELSWSSVGKATLELLAEAAQGVSYPGFVARS